LPWTTSFRGCCEFRSGKKQRIIGDDVPRSRSEPERLGNSAREGAALVSNPILEHAVIRTGRRHALKVYIPTHRLAGLPGV
jgi:hypothetical protein